MIFYALSYSEIMEVLFRHCMVTGTHLWPCMFNTITLVWWANRVFNFKLTYLAGPSGVTWATQVVYLLLSATLGCVIGDALEEVPGGVAYVEVVQVCCQLTINCSWGSQQRWKVCSEIMVIIIINCYRFHIQKRYHKSVLRHYLPSLKRHQEIFQKLI